ncbi:MAG TPA: DnaB-like helicase C-terminal domain-containing protein [Patescibacteria group bacterium]|nr:DnaB-like helicase C-terminal domain-containing protein [Patescibacteria group bacterium]
MSENITVPTDLEAERICVGACLVSHSSMEIVLDRLDDSAFNDTRHKIIFGCIRKFYEAGDNPTFVDVARSLASSNQTEDAGGIQYIKSLEIEARNAEIRYYASQLEEARSRRHLVFLGRRLLCAGSGEVMEHVQHASEILSKVASKSNKPPRSIREITKNRSEGLNAVDYYIKRKMERDAGVHTLMGVPTGWYHLDQALDGLIKRELIILAGRPGMGKSEILIQMALSMARKGVTSMLFSLEMSDEAVHDRVFGMLSGIHAKRLRTGNLTSEEVSRLPEAGKMFEDIGDRILIDETPSANAHHIKARLRHEIITNGVKVALIDHLSKIASEGKKNLYESVTENSGAMKTMAQELNIPVVVAAQLNREVTKVPGSKPNMAHLRDSGAIEQDADKIIMIHRDNYSDKKSTSPIVELIIEKNREGDRKTIYFNYNDHTAHFSETDQDAAAKTVKTIVEDTSYTRYERN